MTSGDDGGGISRLTTLLIQGGGDDVYVGSIGPYPDGRFSFHIGTVDFSPSGSPRPRPLLTSGPTWDTAAEAVQAGGELIAKIRSRTAGEMLDWPSDGPEPAGSGVHR